MMFEVPCSSMDHESVAKLARRTVELASCLPTDHSVVSSRQQNEFHPHQEQRPCKHHQHSQRSTSSSTSPQKNVTNPPNPQQSPPHYQLFSCSENSNSPAKVLTLEELKSLIDFDETSPMNPIIEGIASEGRYDGDGGDFIAMMM